MTLSEIKIVIVGAGKISYSLSNALINSGFEILSVISKSIKSARKLSSEFSIKHYSDKLKEIPSAANFIILAVPDSQIESVSKQLSLLKRDFSKSIFAHLSGVESSVLLDPLRKKGGKIASFHIMQTFPSVKVINLKGAHSAIETPDEETHRLLFKLSRKLNLEPFRISAESKILYHLSGVYASNFLTGNFFIADKLFGMVADKNFEKVINPIVKTTLNNISKTGAVSSLSGPVERGDKETILKHLAAFDLLIKKNRDKKVYRQLKQNYIVQSLNLIGLIRERGGRLGEKYRKLEKTLLEKLNKKK